MVGRLNAGDVDRSIEGKGMIRFNVQLIAELENDWQSLVDNVAADTWRPNRQRVGRRRTANQSSGQLRYMRLKKLS